jgi:hypothetical protein
MRKWSLGRFSIQLALGLAMLVAAAVLAIAFMALQTERRLRTSLASIRAAGDPSSISELAPKPIPMDKNAAVVLAGLGPQLDAFSKDHARFFYTPSGKAYEARTDEGEQATEEQIAAIRAILEKYPEIPTGLTQAAEREQYASLADYSLDHQKFLDQWLKKYVGRIRAAGRFLQWRNEVLLAEGKHEEAVEQGVELLRLARLYDGEPLMVNYLAGVAVRGIAVNMLYDALAAGPVRPELHAALEKELALHDTPQRIVHALKTDRAYSASLAADGGANPNTKENPILVSLFGWTLKRHFISALDYSDEQIAMVQKSWPNANRRVGRGSAPGEGELGTLAALMVPGLQAAYNAEARTVAVMRALRIFNALRQFAEENGREAAGLEKLNLPAAATGDPYSGNPLLLKSTADGWVVYSVMKNGVDDGGDFKEMKDFGVAPRKLRATE